ncbi:MAG: type IV pilus secretin family protein [Methylococcaceae bacterium]|nr:MAG: type IV pilus secretin family protein [Methylococcaceae bacterium]
MLVRKLFLNIAGLIGLALLSLSAAHADALRLEAVDFATLSGDQLRLDFTLSGAAAKPAVFHTDNPARIALDFANVANGLGGKPLPIDTGVARSLIAVETQGRTRVVVNLLSQARYDVAADGNHVFLTMRSGSAAKSAATPSPGSKTPVLPRIAAGSLPSQSLRNVDFVRGDKGEGRVLIALSDANTVADMRREGGKIVVYIPGAGVPPELEKKLDVTDFATPVRSIETQGETGRAKIAVTPIGEDYDYSSYQTDNLLTIEFRALAKAELEERKKKEAAYSGERLSLNFQDIPVRQVLQILADFTNQNMVASDTVQGNVTLRLNDVPWDQALDIVLKTKGLAKRQEGNVVRIGPSEEIQKQEQQDLAANRRVEELEPLKTELIAVKYAKAEDMKTVLTGASSTSAPTAAASTNQSTAATPVNTSESESVVDVSQSVLSARGSVTVDARTNTLVVKDTTANIERVRQLINQLDVSVRQVLIESRIVIADDRFTRNLGAKLTANRVGASSSTASNTTPGTVSKDGSLTFMNSLVDLAAATPQGRLGATILRAGGTLLDLELSAGQLEGKSELLSNPRLLTSDGTKAVIKQGTQIPVQSQQSGTAGGTTTVTYKDALLMLEVTPHIAPDDNVIVDLHMTKDSVGQVLTSANGNQNPSIDKKELQTSIQINDGDTVVLGGVYEDEQRNDIDKIPFLSEIPGLGHLFSRSTAVHNKRELLVFVTPKIVRQEIARNP